jgi:hypothetical protein
MFHPLSIEGINEFSTPLGILDVFPSRKQAARDFCLVSVFISAMIGFDCPKYSNRVFI